MESWIWVVAGIGTISLINAISRINSKLDEIIKKQNEIEENILQEVCDYGIEKNDFETPEDVGDFVSKIKNNQLD